MWIPSKQDSRDSNINNFSSINRDVDSKRSENCFSSHGNNYSIPSNPLFSSIFTLYLLILLYFPHFFLKFLLSPIFIYSIILLLSLLRLGASQRNQDYNALTQTELNQLSSGPEPKSVETKEKTEPASDHEATESPMELELEPETEPNSEPKPKQEVRSEIIDPIIPNQANEGAQSSFSEAGSEPTTEPGPKPEPAPFEVRDPKQITREKFVKWEVSAPLEVIYEAYEGEEDGDHDKNDPFRETSTVSNSRYSSPPLCYNPESESILRSDTYSGLDEEEEEREGFIEIDLEHGDEGKVIMKKSLMELGDEEDNFIEIDVFSFRNGYGFCR